VTVSAFRVSSLAFLPGLVWTASCNVIGKSCKDCRKGCKDCILLRKWW
jgi:hypothetical protein